MTRARDLADSADKDIAGTLTLDDITLSNDITLADNGKAIFGAGSDLTISHDTTGTVGSYITEAGTGSLNIRGQNIIFANADGSEEYGKFFNGAGVEFNYADATKFATTSTGVDITGTLTSDGLTVDGDASIQNTGNSYRTLSIGANRSASVNTLGRLDYDWDGTPVARIHAISGTDATNKDNGDLVLSTSEDGTLKQRIFIDQGGDISFYEDTGTTAKFFWDASAEKLGIGTTTPDAMITVDASVDETAFKSFSSTSGNLSVFTIEHGSDLVSLTAFNSGDALAFGSAGSERMRIDSSGNVGIGFNNPDAYIADASSLVVKGQLRAQGITNTAAVPVIGVRDDNTGFYLPATNTLGITTNGSERMRLDASGNLLVGGTTTNHQDGSSQEQLSYINGSYFAVSRSQGTVAYLNRQSTDGEIVSFRKDGGAVGSIGVHTGNSETDFSVYSAVTGGGGLMFGNRIQPMRSGTRSDNTMDLGSSTYRFDDIYASNTSIIGTSDKREKQDIAELDEAEQRVAVACKGLLRKFRWKDAVAKKGDDARIHFGIIAQDLQAAFAAEGLDAGDYAMFISSTWTDEETGEERTRMGVRYSELLAFIIAAI